MVCYEVYNIHWHVDMQMPLVFPSIGRNRSGQENQEPLTSFSALPNIANVQLILALSIHVDRYV